MRRSRVTFKLKNIRRGEDILPERCPRGYWENRALQRIHFDEVAESFNIQTQNEWYTKISKKHFKDTQWGRLVLANYKSVSNALQVIYPEFTWHAWLFRPCPPKFWKDENNHRKYFEWLKDRLSIREDGDWGLYTLQDIEEIEGSGAVLLKKYYGASLQRALAAVYPEKKWSEISFYKVPQGYWQSLYNQRKFFDWLADELKLDRLDDWYNVTKDQLMSIRGAGVFFDNEGRRHSLYKLLNRVYPEYGWKEWLFAKCSPGVWNSDETIRDFINWFEQKFFIKNLNDWYEVSYDHLKSFGAGVLLLKFGSMEKLLSHVYPQKSWNPKLFTNRLQWNKDQIRVLRIIQKHVNNIDIEVNFKHPDFIYSATKRNMELDIYLPKHSLAIEYQGEQHFKSHRLFGDVYADIKRRDEEKQAACQRAGITLVIVPYWWDKEEDSLLATIHELRPELVKKPPHAKPIPKQRESNVLQ